MREGSTDFSTYFLSFSFFLIAAALLLVGLLFRLNLDLRGREIGVLLATGWDFGRVRRLAAGRGKRARDPRRLPGPGRGGRLRLSDADLSEAPMARRAERAISRTARDRTKPGDRLDRLGDGEFPDHRLGDACAEPDAARSLAGRGNDGEQLRIFPLPCREVASRWTLIVRWIVVIGCLLLAAGSLACGVVLSDHEAKAGSFFAAGFFLLTAMLTLIWHVLKRTDFRSQPRQTLVGLASAMRVVMRFAAP